MNSNLFKSVGQVVSKTVPLLTGLMLFPLVVKGTDSTPVSLATSTILRRKLTRQIFINSAIWDIQTTPLPYQTAHTLNYTNESTMTGSVGWEFDYGLSVGGTPSGRGMSAIFFNDSPGTIQALDGNIPNPLNGYVSATVSYVLISATNIVNKGTLLAGANGEIVLNGSNVILSRSTLRIPPIQGSGSENFFSPVTNYFLPDTAIYDEYWGEGSTNVLTPAVWQNGAVAASAATPNVLTVDPCSATNAAPLLSFAPSFSAWTNIPDPNSITNISTNGVALVTNRIFRQAVFVVANDPAILTNNNPANALIRFTPSGSISNLFRTVSVRLHATNGSDLYVVDALGSSTNRGVIRNNSGLIPGSNPKTPCTGPSYRPANYLVERLDSSFTNGSAGNVTLPPTNFLYDMSFSNTLVTADVSAYQAFVDDLGYDPSGSAITNLPGRIIINANNLDLGRTVISNSGPEVIINANNITNSVGAVISCQNVSYNLSSSSGTVKVLNLATNGTLPGLNGTISLWSAVWTNYQTVFVPAAATNNTSELDYHVLLVDATGLSSTVPVSVQDLVLQTNAVISDPMNVAHTFLFNGSSLTLNGTLNLSGNNLQNWNSSLAPSLLYFTNNGSLSIPNNAHFGDDTAVPYAEFVNNGQIQAAGMVVRSLDFQINGVTSSSYIYTSSGSFLASVQSAELNGTAGGIYSVGNIQFNANSLLMSNFSMDSFGGALNFAVTNSLSDNGSINTLDCANGFNLFVSPSSGNLSASTIIDTASGNQMIDHEWAGQDSGSGAPGPRTMWPSAHWHWSPRIRRNCRPSIFTVPAGNNAMYVKTLDLSQLTGNPADLTSMIQIDPGMTIYFANVTANAAFISKLTGGQTPAPICNPNSQISLSVTGM